MPSTHLIFFHIPPPLHRHSPHSSPHLQEENHPVLSAEQLQLLMQLSQGQQQGQGQGASAAAVLNVPQEDDQQEQPTQPSQGVGTSPNKASLETLHQLLQLQLLQQQLNATAAQPQSTEQTVSLCH